MVELPTHILNHLIHDEPYCRQVIPFIKPEYFEGKHNKLFEIIVKFVAAHNKLPTSKILELELAKQTLPQDQITSLFELVQEITTKSDVDIDYLLSETEAWCKDRALYLAIMESITIIDGNHQTLTEGSIPDIMTDALSVSFDKSVGHDYIDDADERFEYYNRIEEKLPFDLEYFNRITKGGLSKKTLNVCLAGVGVGKSLFMCHMAASALAAGKNVVYITMEMAEEQIAKRIDANLFDVPMDSLETMTNTVYSSKIKRIKNKSTGKLIIKEYPTAAANAGHFRALFNELKLKKNFTPDLIFVDYLNICGSSRMKGLGNSINTYSLVKSIAEEIRGLAIEFAVPIMTATQTTRSGYSNTDVGLDDTAESFGLPATADLMFALISSEELEELDQFMVKQLKNRYSSPSDDRKFVIGVDKTRMKLYDVEQSAQDDIAAQAAFNDRPLNSFGDRESPDHTYEIQV
ncbi:MAG TPA: DNA primase [Flavobacteriales bacterium]|nr:DNA primase [Flavobacteriales bacterium]